MLKKITLTASILYTAINLEAQTPLQYHINDKYKNALELLEKGKYATASSLFRDVEKLNYTTSEQADNRVDISEIKINAQYYRALCALELKNDDAIDLFLSFIRQHPESAKTKQAYFQVGRYYFRQANYKEALNWFTKVSTIDMSGDEAIEYKFKTAYSYFEVQNYEDAKPLFNMVQDTKSDYAEQATYYYAYIAYLDKDYKASLKSFEKLKNSKNYERSYPYYISAIYFLDKRYDDVIAYAIPILNTTQQQYETQMFRIVAASYFAKEDYANAAKYYEKFIANDGGKSQNNQDSYQIGYTYYKLKKYDKAVEQLIKLNADLNAHSQFGFYTLGDSYLKTLNKQGARNAFLESSKMNFDADIQEDALFNFAKLSYELEFHNIALDAAKTYLKNYPRSPKLNEAKTLLANILLNTKNYREAIDILEGIKNKDEDAKEAYQKVTYFRALEFYNERAFENAIGMFLKSNTYPIDPEVHALATYWCAESMYEVRKYGESVNYFENFLKMPASRKTDLYNYANYALGYAALEGENYGKAATYLDKFLKGNEKDQSTINDATLRLADAYFGSKNYGAALSYYNRIIASKTSSEDYALFQRGVIEGLMNQPDTKIATLQSLLNKFPNSNYADDAGFEIAYTYFLIGQGEKSRSDLVALIEKYPRSSYVPRALVTIGLVYYDQQNDAAALDAFKKVVSEYKSTDEAQQAIKLIERIYIDSGNATGFIDYANTTSIGNYTVAEQDNIMFQAANARYLRGDWNGAVESINAYFDKFPKAIQDKQAKFIRAESYKNLGKYAPAIIDYEYILNDWTSEYTERALMSISSIYLKNKQYNEAIVHLKKLEIASEYKANYQYAINNLMKAYEGLVVPDEVLKYAKIIREYEKSSEQDKDLATLYAGKAYLIKGENAAAQKEFDALVKKSKTVEAAEAKYLIAKIEYEKKDYKASQKTCFDLINNMPNYDYWVAKSFLLLADNYVALKDTFQAKSTLQSIIDNYEGNDDILPEAKEKLQKLNSGK
ncbi:Tetratricopeptide TPR_1 repeat-containing protein [Pseudopedobacter saltans DSM 12145]|uniref:Tetratricopeptide TPR_1 repeat-containing protein n=1 Tax=Pseudopedobacter saltans (strain ATCC 51119 / DSM 12145 / JCM 21818 / CCUG 39354 / LMG 10337 / NBRC 100064 / NCIMB 13643) TaxID=762903 RepID=F0S9C1_PSESL|nr:tetratricopeptide repeat protein [Pseudopedobacter saltans]ADY52471.1 Tetratricopeptide TPR_1 repeat-containing protein [Pseudopedobacter saltans DSM 12145]